MPTKTKGQPKKRAAAMITHVRLPHATGRQVVRALTTPVAVRFTEDEADLRRLLEARAQAHDRSLSGQIKHYARLAAIAEDNPDLPMAMIHGILEAQAEVKAGLAEPYRWGIVEDA
jgi:hypothetical protein